MCPIASGQVVATSTTPTHCLAYCSESNNDDDCLPASRLAGTLATYEPTWAKADCNCNYMREDHYALASSLVANWIHSRFQTPDLSPKIRSELAVLLLSVIECVVGADHQSWRQQASISEPMSQWFWMGAEAAALGATFNIVQRERHTIAF